MIHNFRYKARVEHDILMNNISKGSCVSRGGGGASYKIKLKSQYILSKKSLMDIKISIIDICYANTAPIPNTLMVSLLHK